MRELLGRAERGGQRRHLGLAVEVPEAYVGKPFLQLPEDLDRHRRGAVVALGQRAQVGLVEVRDDAAGRSRPLVVRRTGWRRAPRSRPGSRPGPGPRRITLVAPSQTSGAEEDVELRAVVERQRVQVDVVRAVLAVDHAGGVLPQQRPAREQRALGPRLGAGGEHHPDRVVVLDQHFRRRPVVLEPVLQISPAVRNLSAGQPHDTLRRDRPAQDRLQGPVRGGHQGVLDHEGLGAAALEDERDLVAAEHEVDRHQHDADPRGGEVEHRELPAVVAQQREPVALGQAGVGHRGRGPVDSRVELGEGQPHLPVDDRHLVGKATGGAAGQVAE